ncbi:MAG TPA: divalent metal cation transporter, partial [Candidatus Aquilonibacter sp.]
MASLAVVGAATGYMLSWLVVLLFPMIAIVQSVAASVGTSGSSIQQAIRRRYGLAVALVALILVVAVNIATLGADIEAGAESLTLLFGLPRQAFVLPFALLVAVILLTNSYVRIERILSFLPLIFVSYVASAILARPDWGALLHSLVVPRFAFTPVVVTAALALLGTTLTSYVYYWEQIEVSERRGTPEQLPELHADAAWGAVAPAICFLFVLVATAATLGKVHATVQTATDAAIALQPLAGRWATTLFAIGLLASAALAVPILAGTSGYVVTQTFGWRGNLGTPVAQAREFYAVIVGSLLLASAFTFAGIAPIALLYWASVAGGLGTPVTLWLLVAIARNRTIMGPSRISNKLAAAGYIIAAVVTLSCVLFLVQALSSSISTLNSARRPSPSVLRAFSPVVLSSGSHGSHSSQPSVCAVSRKPNPTRKAITVDTSADHPSAASQMTYTMAASAADTMKNSPRTSCFGTTRHAVSMIQRPAVVAIIPMSTAAMYPRCASSAACAPTIAYHGSVNAVMNWNKPSLNVCALLKSTRIARYAATRHKIKYHGFIS